MRDALSTTFAMHSHDVGRLITRRKLGEISRCYMYVCYVFIIGLSVRSRLQCKRMTIKVVEMDLAINQL